jgi:hypothetical protein
VCKSAREARNAAIIPLTAERLHWRFLLPSEQSCWKAATNFFYITQSFELNEMGCAWFISKDKSPMSSCRSMVWRGRADQCKLSDQHALWFGEEISFKFVQTCLWELLQDIGGIGRRIRLMKLLFMLFIRARISHALQLRQLPVFVFSRDTRWLQHSTGKGGADNSFHLQKPNLGMPRKSYNATQLALSWQNVSLPR